MTDDNARITTLTSDAIRATGEKMIADIHAQVKMVDEMAEGIHTLAKRYEEEIGKRTLELTDHIGAYQALGAKSAEMFRTMSEAMAPLMPNGDGRVLPAERVGIPRPAMKPTRGPRPVDLDSELGELAVLAASPIDGQR